MALNNPACTSCCEQVVKWISAIIGTFGILILVFGWMQTDYLPPASDYITVDIPKSGYGVLVIILGLLGLFVGLLGWTVARKKGFMLSTVFIIVSVIMGAILVAIGAAMGGILSESVLLNLGDKVCTRGESLNNQYYLAVDR